MLRRIQTINNTKIQYLSVADKIYKVTAIDFHNLTIEAARTDLSIADIPENEVFPIEEFGEFRVRLCNDGRMGAIVDFAEWIKDRESDKNYGKRI
jgi:hypothetical protein